VARGRHLLAIGAGGVLFDAATWLPFATGALLTALSVLIFLGLLDRYATGPRRDPGEAAESLREQLRHLSVLVRGSGAIREFLVANALWELSLGALKTFVILYLTEGLDIGISVAAAMVAGVAVFVALAAPISGRLADRFGTQRILHVSLTVYGAGLLVPFLVDEPWVVALVAPVIGFGGGVVMTLPYALLIPLMPPGDHGLATGLYSVSRGIGTSLGPLLAGIAITALDGVFAGTDGYQAMWGVCAVAILASLPFLARVRH
jgi:MFS family permease